VVSNQDSLYGLFHDLLVAYIISRQRFVTGAMNATQCLNHRRCWHSSCRMVVGSSNHDRPRLFYLPCGSWDQSFELSRWTLPKLSSRLSFRHALTIASQCSTVWPISSFGDIMVQSAAARLATGQEHTSLLCLETFTGCHHNDASTLSNSLPSL